MLDFRPYGTWVTLGLLRQASPALGGSALLRSTGVCFFWLGILLRLFWDGVLHFLKNTIQLGNVLRLGENVHMTIFVLAVFDDGKQHTVPLGGLGKCSHIRLL
ncbi:hypothetical protein SDC9_179974 [bioreactor metagenome]|uniref:Uncharacterized protein n=1 Tax=bioreactor metagenome TaxID=1076179 RepID=A0A645H0C6_9ZZZZ